MSNRRKLWRRYEDDPLTCQVCGVLDSEQHVLRFGIGVVVNRPADKEKLVAYAYGGRNLADMPSVRPTIVGYATEHSEAELIRAGIVPDAMIDGMSNLREMIDEWWAAVAARVAA